MEAEARTDGRGVAGPGCGAGGGALFRCQAAWPAMAAAEVAGPAIGPSVECLLYSFSDIGIPLFEAR
jgi:hypothetical protein